ncbi:hypothetical protein J7L01_03305 [bacterium]|nr:hypothetical protein [bacterium]
MKIGAINKILLVILAFTVCTFSVEAGDVLKYNIVDNGSALSIGTIVKIVSDTTIDVCGEGELPVGVIIGYEGASSDPDYYLVANSGIASNVRCGETISDGDKLVPYTFGSVRKLATDPTGYVVGVALEDGSLGNRIKMMVDIVTGGGAGGGGADDDWQVIGDGTPPDTVYNLSDYIGIGTSTPAEKLDVNGNLYLSGGDLRTDRWTGGATSTYIGMSVAGNCNITGNNNTYLGYQTGYGWFAGGDRTASGFFNTFVGATAGAWCRSGSRNTFVGRQSGFFNELGNQNTFVGSDAGQGNYDGDYNTLVGCNAGYSTQNSDKNTFLGASAGYKTTGYNNTFIGYTVGDSVTTGHDNILIGCDVDAPSPTTNNYLNIGDLIYGDLSNGFVGIGVDSPEVALHIEGSARFNTLASAPASPDSGEIYSNGENIWFYNGSSWDDLTAGSGGASQWTEAPAGYIYSNDNTYACVYDDGDTAYFYAESDDGYGGIFITEVIGANSYAGVYGLADAAGDADNFGVYGKNGDSGNYGYIGGEHYGVFGRSVASSGDGQYGALGAPDTGVIGYVYHTSNTIIGGHFKAENASGNTNTVYGLYSKATGNSGTKYGLYSEATGDGSGTAYGVYAAASGADTAIAVYGESDQSNGIGLPFTYDWEWIGDVSTSSDTAHGGWVSTDDDAIISEYGRPAIYGKNTASYGVAIAGRNSDATTTGVGVFGYAGKFGIVGVSSGSGTARAGGFFHCNNWGSKGAARERSGVGVFSDGGTAGTVSLSPFLGIYSATTIDSKGGAAYFSGNSYVSNGFSLSLIDTSSANNNAARVAAFDQVNLVPKIQTEGIARLDGGRCIVRFPRSFARTIKRGERPVIILTPYSVECGRLAVTRIDENGFVVEEMEEGHGDSEFAWMAVATRADYLQEDAVPEEILGSNFDKDFSKSLPLFDQRVQTEDTHIIQGDTSR